MDFFRQQPEYKANREYFEEEYRRQYGQDYGQSSGDSSYSSSSSSSRGHHETMGYDPYAALEVSPGASFEDIEKAYKKLVRKYHPDRYQDDKERETATRVMTVINASYTFLKQKHGKK